MTQNSHSVETKDTNPTILFTLAMASTIRGKAGLRVSPLILLRRYPDPGRGSNEILGFTFPNSGVTLNINIPPNPRQIGGIVDGATAENGFETFQVVALDESQLVVDGDGVALNQIYILIHNAE